MKNTNTNEMSQKTLKKAKINLLETIENIIELAENSKLGKEIFTKAKVDLQALSEELNLTTNQALLFAVMINFCSDPRIRFRSLTKFFDCREIKLFRMQSDFEALKERKLICIRNSKDDPCYSIPNEVVVSLKNNEIYESMECEVEICNLSDWFERLSEVFEDFEDDDIDFDTFKDITRDLINDYPRFDFLKKIKKLKLDDVEMKLLVFICHYFVNKDDDNVRFSDLKDYISSHNQRRLKDFFKAKNFASEQSPLFEKNIVEWVNENDVGHRKSVKLTDSAKEDLLAELKLNRDPKQNRDFILNKNIVEKSLFYNEKEEKQVSELQKLLLPNNFKNVLKRLKEKGMQQGFSCLFYGSPGTGKTESVFQLAKQTKRDIFFVDISNTKSCWFGESEKKIKEVFNKYRTLVENSKTTPILLFNEADAVFGKRKNVSISDVAQTENAIQNIILQEMENLNGILIATTNLTDNLDSAFERRFVYKIKFEKPIITAKQKIWQNKLPWLNDDEGLRLATTFDFSGGEIDNIVRKTTINEIIFGENPQFSDLEKLCSEEKITQRPSIGFR